MCKKAMATHSSTLAWQIPWTEEPGRLQSMGSLRVGHFWATSISLSCTGEGNGNPLQCSCLENPRDREAWWAAVYGVAQSWTWLKWLSSSSIYVQWFIHPPIEGYIGCFRFWAIINKAAYEYLHACNCVRNFKRNSQGLFQRGCTFLHFHQQWIRVPVAPCSSQHLILLVFGF